MKQFKKWWKVAHAKHCWGKSGHDKNVAEKTWKATLEWISNEKSYDMQDCIYDELGE